MKVFIIQPAIKLFSLSAALTMKPVSGSVGTGNLVGLPWTHSELKMDGNWANIIFTLHRTNPWTHSLHTIVVLGFGDVSRFRVLTEFRLTVIKLSILSGNYAHVRYKKHLVIMVYSVLYMANLSWYFVVPLQPLLPACYGTVALLIFHCEGTPYTRYIRFKFLSTSPVCLLVH